MTMKPILTKSLFVIVPYIIGLALSSTILPYVSSSVAPTNDEASSGIQQQKLEAKDKVTDQESLFENLSFAIHRNGEVSPCGNTIPDFESILLSIISSQNVDEEVKNLDDLRKLDLTKHEVDSVLTGAFGKYLLSLSSCGPEQPPESIQGWKRKTWGRGLDYKIKGVDSAFLTFCDMGEERTPVLHDHHELVPVWSGEYDDIDTLPCHFHTREGLRITSLDQLIDLAKTATESDSTTEDEENCKANAQGEQTCEMPSKMIHLYAVPAGRLFMFAPSYVGETFVLDHVDHPGNPEHVTLRVLSVSPRVFDVVNFFEPRESKAIVDKALKETSESHRIKRSSTGASGYNLNNQRTSENGFDTHGKAAVAVKQRSLTMLGFDEYVESYTDGLQVLRYNKTTAYIPHMDWIDDPGHTNPHDFDSAKVGTNRFATVLLYMTDLKEGDGGETVFKNGWPEDVPVEERRVRSDVLQELRRTGEVSFLKEGSWEESMVADCRSRLAVRPHAGRAVLFYSQHPNGEEDLSSLHGGCPVLHGEKWAANNWVWNGPRGGFPGSPKNKKFQGTREEALPIELSGIFTNTGKDPKYNKAKLYFQETEWGDFSPGKTHSVNTYEGHEWNVIDSDGTLLKRWLVKKGPRRQRFEV